MGRGPGPRKTGKSGVGVATGMPVATGVGGWWSWASRTPFQTTPAQTSSATMVATMSRQPPQRLDCGGWGGGGGPDGGGPDGPPPVEGVGVAEPDAGPVGPDAEPPAVDGAPDATATLAADEPDCGVWDGCAP